MKRRNFIKNVSLAGVPLIFKGIPVHALAELGSSPLAPMAKITAQSDKILVIIQLNGGNDGLNTVVPLDKYSKLASARPNIILPENKVLGLDGHPTIGLHPSMSGLRNLHNNGHLAIIQGVSYPNPVFSHFHAQDIWFSGMGAANQSDTGWMGRTLEKKFPGFPEGYPDVNSPDPPAVQIGGVTPLSLKGSEINMGYNVPNPTDLINIVNESPGNLPNTDYGNELGFLRLMKSQSNVYADNVTSSYNAQPTMSNKYPSSGSSLAEQLKIVARLIGGGLKTPVYVVNQDSNFDTHVNQVSSTNTTQGNHAGFLEKLSTAVEAFMDDLVLMGKADKVIGMTFSEFGRRVINNASFGTDHGSAAPIFVFGSKVNPGVYGVSPNLPDISTANTQVDTQFDYRQVYATVMREWLNVSDTDTQDVLHGQYDRVNFLANGGVDAVLPIDVIELTVKQTELYDELSFVAHSNHFYERFILEISTNGQTFNKVSNVQQVSNETLKTYHLRREKRSEARIYYRICGISKQQEIAYSNLVVVKNAFKQFFSLYPNPVTNQTFNIQFSERPKSNVTIEIFDLRGARLFYNQYQPNLLLQVKLNNDYDLNQVYIAKVSFDKEQITEKILFR